MMSYRKSHLPLVSVIIPTKNAGGTIDLCISSIKSQSYKNIEVIVVDNYSHDTTRVIAENHGAKIFLKGPERSAQLNFGAEKAKGKYLYRVDADFILQTDVIKEAVAQCEDEDCDAVAIHNTSDPTISFWSKIRKLERDCYRDDELNVAARFWRKDVFFKAGCFDEELIAGDDYDLHNRIIGAGFKIGRIKSEESHIGEPLSLREVVNKHFFYGKNITRFIHKNQKTAMLQLNPFRKSYFTNIRRISSDPALLVGFVVYELVRYFATAIGILTKF